MKRHKGKSGIISVMLLAGILVLILAGCGSLSVNVVLIFDTLDERENVTLEVSSAAAFDIPQTPEKEGYIFDGWYWDKDGWKEPLTASSLSGRPLENTMRVYAKWVEKKTGKLYTVTYVDGAERAESEAEYGSVLEQPDESMKDGYRFAGWYRDEECKAEWDFSTDRVSGNTILYAKRIKQCKVTLDYSYDGKTEELACDEGEEVELPVPERQNYSFEGWTDGEGRICTSLTLGSDATVHAVWKRIFSIEYTDGAVRVEVRQKEGEPISLPETPAKEGYSFSGWYADGELLNAQTLVGKDLSASARWEEIYCKISFEIDGVREYERDVRYGEDMTDIPSLPQRAGYLGYWEKDEFLSVKADAVVSAVYRPNRYRLIFNGTVISYDYKEEVRLSAADRDGKSFSHWEVSGLDIAGTSERELVFSMPANEVYIEGIYLTSGKVSVTFDSAGGSAVNTQEITLGERAVRPEDPVKDDYKFLGWSLEDGNESDYWSFLRDRVYENIRLTACWKLKDYTYTDNGSGIRIERYIGELETATIPKEVNGKKVEEIAGGAFSRKSGLKEIIFPETALTVEYESVYKCPDLERLRISFDMVFTAKQKGVGGQGDILTYIYGVEKFGTGVTMAGKERLRAIEIVNTKALPKAALSGCDSLESVTFDANTASIGEKAFYNCKNLRSIVIPKSVTHIANNAFQGCGLLEEIIFGEDSGLTEIGAYAFTECESIREMVLPDSLKLIGEGAFTNCSGLENVQTGAGLEVIEMYAFTRCMNLREVNLTESTALNEICDSAFMGCESLEEIRIPQSVSYMGYGVFEGGNMQRVYLGSSAIPAGWEGEWNIGVREVILAAK